MSSFQFEATHIPDNGLGFGQGSTAGVKSTFMCRGFHRPGMPTAKRRRRDVLNLRPCKGAYACHYDPEPCHPDELNGYVENEKQPVVAVRQDHPNWKRIAFWITVILLTYYFLLYKFLSV